MPNESPHQSLLEIIRTRRTISHFRAEPVPHSILLEALEAAIWAPNHRHTHPWRFTLLGPEIIAQLIAWNTESVAAKKGIATAEEKRRRWETVPGWLVVTSIRSDDSIQDEENFAACCCAVQNFSLSLWSRGIGVKWSTGDITRHPQFFPLLKISPANERLVGLFWYGYPESIPQQSRPPIEQFLRTR